MDLCLSIKEKSWARMVVGPGFKCRLPMWEPSTLTTTLLTHLYHFICLGTSPIHPGAVSIHLGASGCHNCTVNFWWTLMTCKAGKSHMVEFTLAFINCWYTMHKSPVRYCDSFITIETYIYITSMMMLNITIEVCVNNSLPLNGWPQAKLGHFSWALLHLGYFWLI